MRISKNLSLSLAALLFAVVFVPSLGWSTTERPDNRPPEASPETGAPNTVYFFDDFENGLSKWTTSTGYWGAATCDYRSTTTSVSATPVSKNTCPPTNYPLNVDASLTLADSYKISLSGATYPILTFWHKYSIASTCCTNWDYGYVEYSTDFGVAWTKLTNQDTQSPDSNGPGFTGTIGSWYPEEFDLTQIPGWKTLTNPILIRFRLWDGGYGSTSWGWMIDDVEVREKGTTLNVGLTTSISPSGGGTVTGAGIDCPGTCVELWPANWSLSGRDWSLEDVTVETPPDAMSAIPDFSFAGNYALYADSVLEQATPVSLAGATAPTLSIWTQYSIASTCCTNWDYGYVEYSTNYGLTWTKLTNQDTTSPDGNGPGFNGTVTSWTQEQFDLTKITNWQTLPIEFRFRLWDGGYGNTGWGWLIDDPEIYDPATNKAYFGPDTFGSGSLPNFSNVTLTATPDTNYTFDGWTGCNSTSGNECTINRYIDRVVTANFTQGTSCTPVPALTLSHSSLAFSEQPIDTASAAKSVTATNTGSCPINISSITPSANFAVSSTTCGATLAAGKTCKVSIAFMPTALGAVTGTLTFTDSASNSPQTVSLTGTGEAQATLTPASHTFPKTKVGNTSAAAKFTLKNNLKTTLTGISYSVTSGGPEFSIDSSSSTCGTTLNAGKTCIIEVTFTPAGAQAYTGTLSVSDSANNSPQTATLKGTGELK